MPLPSHVTASDVSSTVIDVRRTLSNGSDGPTETVSWSQISHSAKTDRTRLKKAMERIMAESLESAGSETGGVSRFNSSP